MRLNNTNTLSIVPIRKNCRLYRSTRQYGMTYCAFSLFPPKLFLDHPTQNFYSIGFIGTQRISNNGRLPRFVIPQHFRPVSQRLHHLLHALPSPLARCRPEDSAQVQVNIHLSSTKYQTHKNRTEVTNSPLPRARSRHNEPSTTSAPMEISCSGGDSSDFLLRLRLISYRQKRRPKPSSTSPLNFAT